ncbi:hypothetical protein [Streptomyces sp. CoT10]|uniref:hypothetical protein n=1 Tax=Streptomyces sp. CoT10 TaxID=2875762 RepID=UPI001CD3D9F7|nr:hypothetical protein [Streptomyces sp. CoT10]
MIITYVQDDGTELRVSTDDLSAIESADIEEAVGDVPWRAIEDRLRSQDPTCMRAVLWAVRKRTEPGLKFSDYDVPGWRRRLKARLERAEMDEVLSNILAEALAKSEDSAIDAMVPHMRKLAHDPADVSAALEAVGKGHLDPARRD